ncbi:MAG: AAA family ATPase [Phycisphaeraceae bacterium]|nr:AAA family ATPase [Phycisphaeraceae bacterium]
MTAFEVPVLVSPEAGDQASRLRELFRDGLPPVSVASWSAPVIAVTSGKGGVGKTNVSVNLATLLAERHRLTLVDADLGMANADILCGVTPARRLQHALPMSDGSVHGRTGAHPSAGANLASICLQSPLGFSLVPGSVGVARMADLQSAEQRQLLRGLAAVEARSDLVLLDTGAGISPGVLGFLGVSDLVLVVATPEPTSIADAYALIKCFAHRAEESPPCERPGRSPTRVALVINQCRNRREAESVYRRLVGACERFLGMHVPLAGVIEKDGRLVDSVMARTPVVRFAPESSASIGLRSLAMVIESEWLSTAKELTLGKAGRGNAGRFDALRRMWRIRGH